MVNYNNGLCLTFSFSKGNNQFIYNNKYARGEIINRQRGDWEWANMQEFVNLVKVGEL